MNVHEQISQSKALLVQAKVDKKQNIHRNINSVLLFFTVLTLAYAAHGVNKKFDELSYEEHKVSELAQLVQDEGFKRCVYSDSLGKATIGFGHLMLDTDNFEKNGKGVQCIDTHKAVQLLREDYRYAELSVESNYPWAKDEAKLVLINMTYQLGANGLSKFKATLLYLHKEEYDKAAGELLDSRWAKQTPNRASRLAGRIMALNNTK